jgi:hypothetical protein
VPGSAVSEPASESVPPSLSHCDGCGPPPGPGSVQVLTRSESRPPAGGADAAPGRQPGHRLTGRRLTNPAPSHRQHTRGHNVTLQSSSGQIDSDAAAVQIFMSPLEALPSLLFLLVQSNAKKSDCTSRSRRTCFRKNSSLWLTLVMLLLLPVAVCRWV